jgi:(p)ppGpp synthase/HD superfamily hydrolase
MSGLYQEGLDLSDVLEYAHDKHRGQFRKDMPIPYLAHPLDVMKMLTAWGIKDHYTLAAALLHDTAEESSQEQVVTFVEIEDRFDLILAEIVRKLSFRGKDETESDDDYRWAKNLYLGGFGEGPVEAAVVKVADRICNYKDFKITSPNYADKYWNKAVNAGLFRAVLGRNAEIVDRYGKLVWENLYLAISRRGDM